MNISGKIRVSLTSAEPARALGAITGKGMEVFEVREEGALTVSFWIRRRDFDRLRKLCESRGDSLKQLGRRGFYWQSLALLRRPVLVSGVLLLAVLTIFLPTRVLFLRVEGNDAIPARRILMAAEDCGAGFGASRRHVRSEKVKNALLEAIPELQWAGINTSGCTAVISVRERTPAQQVNAILPGSSLVANRDGYILSAHVTRGTALVQPGQTVRKGQTLVSGYTDCGLCIRATGAEGEILAQTRRDLTAVTPLQWTFRRVPGEIKRKYSLLFRKKRIKLWKDSGICDATCGRMYTEYFLTLPGGFRLPVALCVEACQSWTVEPGELDAETAREALARFGEAYLSRQMVSGKILEGSQDFSEASGLCRMDAVYHCTELIGRVDRLEK